MVDDSVRNAVQRGFDKQGFMQVIGARLGDVGDGTCEVEVPFSSQVAQQHGLFHGGVVASVADNAAAIAAYTRMEPGHQPLTIEFKISLLAPAQGRTIIARASVLRAGRSIVHAKADVYSKDADGEELCATALVTVKATQAVTEL
ncbi:MAG: PaaI family thioesterase [Pseudomonadota bacterium]